MSEPFISEQKLVETELQSMAATRAVVEPFPGPLAKAYTAQPIVLTLKALTESGYQDRKVIVRPYVHSDWIILKKLDSPLYRHALECAKPEGKREETEWSDEDGCEIAFQFTRPAKVVRAVMAKGRDAYREAALQEFGDVFQPTQINEIVEKVIELVTQSWSTMIGHSFEENGHGTNFPEPSRKMESAGAAGGSSTVAAS